MGFTLMIIGICWVALGVVNIGSAAGMPVEVASALFDQNVLIYVLPGLALAGLGRLVQVATTMLARLSCTSISARRNNPPPSRSRPTTRDK